MDHDDFDELWRQVADDILKLLKGGSITGRFRFLNQIKSSNHQNGRIIFTVEALISETDYRLRGMRDRKFWLSMQRGTVFKASELCLDFSPNVDGESVETVTFWMKEPYGSS